MGKVPFQERRGSVDMSTAQCLLSYLFASSDFLMIILTCCQKSGTETRMTRNHFCKCSCETGGCSSLSRIRPPALICTEGTC